MRIRGQGEIRAKGEDSSYTIRHRVYDSLLLYTDLQNLGINLCIYCLPFIQILT